MSAYASCKHYLFRPTVEPVLLIFMFANFMSTPVLQQLIYNMICDDTSGCNTEDQNSTQTRCSEPGEVEQHVQTTTSHWLLYISLANGVPSILSALVAGGASDTVGRKVLIVIASAGGIINVIFIIMTSIANLPKYVFLFGAGVAGLFGGFTVINLAVYSYMADISSLEDRTSRFGILESMTFIGGSLSGVIGGLWIKNGHYTQPFYAVGSLYAVVFIIVIIPHLIPESVVTHDNTITFNVSKLIYQNVKSFIGLFVYGEHSVILLLLLFIFLVVEINFIGLSDVIVLYSLGKPLCWSSDLIGYFLSVKVALNGLAALFVLPLLSRKLTDPIIIIIGLFSGAAALIIMGFSYHTWIMFTGKLWRLLLVRKFACLFTTYTLHHVVPLFGALRGCVVPVLRAMMSKYSPPDKEG